jgi:hypothetical protein
VIGGVGGDGYVWDGTGLQRLALSGRPGSSCRVRTPARPLCPPGGDPVIKTLKRLRVAAKEATGIRG